MKKQPFLFVLIPFFFMIACEEEEFMPEPPVPEEAYEIYSIYLNQHPAENFGLAQESNYGLSRIFFDEESSGRTIQNVFRENPDIDYDMLELFQVMVHDSVAFENNFTIPNKRITLISADERAALFDQDKTSDEIWEEFSMNYGDGARLHAFSRIAFNQDKTEAVFTTGSIRRRSGFGSLIYFRKENNTWILIDSYPIWIT